MSKEERLQAERSHVPSELFTANKSLKFGESQAKETCWELQTENDIRRFVQFFCAIGIVLYVMLFPQLKYIQ